MSSPNCVFLLMIALTAATLFTPLERIERPLLLLDDGVIAEVASQASRELPKGSRVIDLADGILAPGFIDIHNHGGGGHDVMEVAEIMKEILINGKNMKLRVKKLCRKFPVPSSF